MEVKYKELFLVTGNWNDKKLVRRSKQNSKEYRIPRFPVRKEFTDMDARPEIPDQCVISNSWECP